MMEYTNKYWNMLMPFIKKSLNKRYGKAYTKALIPKADAEYRDMLNRSDDIGKDNPMASNTYECLVFLAIWKAADGKISVEDLRAISKDVLFAPIMKVMGILINANKASGIKQIQKMMERDAKWLDEHPQYKKYSWDFHFDEKKHKDGFYYYFTQCPLNTFARREGYLEVLPVMCDIDHITASLMHAKLNRKYTLASGGKVCDYWFVGDKMKNPK